MNYKEMILVATGKKKGSILIKNGKIVNVFSDQIEEADVVIYENRIAGIGEGYEAEIEIDANGSYIIPGLIDSHVHIESSMVMPSEYGKLILQHGVTTIIADPHEIANACGIEGIRAFISDARNTDLEIKFMAPSCVPTVNFEETGFEIGKIELKSLRSEEEVLGLGEMMDYPSIINGDDQVFDKIDIFKDRPVDGHAPCITQKDLIAYSMFISTDHECRTGDELEEKISRGMYVQIRQGTLCQDLDNLIGSVTEKNYKRCIFCSDDKYLGDIVSNGTIDYNVRRAIESGIDPIHAIAIGSINAAECYGLKRRGAIAPNYLADIIISKDLKLEKIERVFKNGIEIKNDKKIKKDNININLLNTVRVNELNLKDFKLKLKSDKVNLIHVEPKTIKTDLVEGEVILENGYFVKGKNKNISKAMVIERYGKTGNIGFGLIENMNIINGAIATTISHDSHNIIVVGDNDEDMLSAVRALGKSGGMAVSMGKGKDVCLLELDVAGLVSSKEYSEVLNQHEKMHKYIEKLNITKGMNPFMTLSFLSLIVIGDIRINTKGLFDVSLFKQISIELN